MKLGASAWCSIERPPRRGQNASFGGLGRAGQGVFSSRVQMVAAAGCVDVGRGQHLARCYANDAKSQGNRRNVSALQGILKSALLGKPVRIRLDVVNSFAGAPESICIGALRRTIHSAWWGNAIRRTSLATAWSGRWGCCIGNGQRFIAWFPKGRPTSYLW